MPNPESSLRLFLREKLIQLDEIDEDFPRLRGVRGAQYARVVELIDDPGRAAIADPQPALKQRCGPTLVLNAQLGGLPEETVPVLGRVCRRTRAFFLCLPRSNELEDIRLLRARQRALL